MKARYVLPILLMISAGGWFWWQGDQVGKKQTHYLTETVRRGTIHKTVNATGTIEASRLVTVGAQVSGKIVELHAALGQKMHQGDLIALIDPSTKEDDLKTARARLSTYTAQLESRKIALKIAQTRYNRELLLKKTDSTSRASLEDAENALAAAKAALKESESLVVQQQMAVNTAETNLGYTRIVAPFDGTIVSIPVKQGQTVNANQTTPTIVQIADLSEMEIKIEVSEGDIPFIKEGQSVRFTLLSNPDKPYSTVVSSIDPADKTLSDATGSASGLSSSAASSSATTSSAVYYYAKAKIPNADGLFRQSMTTNTVIEIDHADNVLMLPSLVISSNARGKQSVRILRNDNPEECEIETGLSNNVFTEICSGLSEGDKVVANQMSEAEMKASLNSRRGPGPRF